MKDLDEILKIADELERYFCCKAPTRNQAALNSVRTLCARMKRCDTDITKLVERIERDAAKFFVNHQDLDKAFALRNHAINVTLRDIRGHAEYLKGKQ